MTTLDVTIGGSPVVTVTLKIDVSNEPIVGIVVYTAEATPVATLRSGTGSSIDEAVRKCISAIIDADEVPS